MSKPPAIPPAYAQVPVSSASAGGGPALRARDAASSPADPPPLGNARQREGGVTMEMLEVKGRLGRAEDMIKGLQSMVIELQSREEASKHERDGLAARLKQAEAHSNRLEAIVTTYLKSQGVDLDNIGDATKMSELVVDKKAGNLTADEAKDLLKIIKESLASIYGVTKFSPKEHGGYPQVSKAHPEWPSRKESGRQVPLHRFDFEEEYTSSKNQPTFDEWVDVSLKQGPALAGVRHLPETVLNRRTVASQCAKYYASIKRQAHIYHGEQKPVAGIKRRGEGLDEGAPKQDPESEADLANLNPFDLGVNLANEAEVAYAPYPVGSMSLDHPMHIAGFVDPQQETGVSYPLVGGPGPSNVQASAEDSKAEVTKPDRNNSVGNIRSRRMTKLATREKKRKALTADNTKYLGAKYDSYFTLGAMSDEEHVETTNEKGEKVVELVSHEYEFASDELVKCRQAIDELPDPTESSKKLKRRRGAPKPGPPPKSKKVENGLRSWMVKADVLAKNPQWFVEGRVYASESEWNLNDAAATGDLAVPKPKKVKFETNPDLQLVQQTQAEWLQAKEQFESWKSTQSSANQGSGENSNMP